MRTCKKFVAIAAVLLISGSVLAGHGHHDGCCPDCGHKVCVFEPEIKKEKKHCWEIETKEICIPKFKWPWECCSTPPACGKVRTIKVLKKKEYECEKCGYKWSVQTVCDEACGPCNNGPCTHIENPSGTPTQPTAPLNIPKPATQTRTFSPTTVPPVTVVEKGIVRMVGK